MPKMCKRHCEILLLKMFLARLVQDPSVRVLGSKARSKGQRSADRSSTNRGDYPFHKRGKRRNHSDAGTDQTGADVQFHLQKRPRVYPRPRVQPWEGILRRGAASQAQGHKCAHRSQENRKNITHL